MKRLLPLCLLFALCPLTAPALLDTNGNGLSDLWEVQFNGGQLFPPDFDPQADPDGDGWTNAQEAVAGTNPFDSTSPGGFLRPQITYIPAVWSVPVENGTPELVTPEAVTITWPTVPGKLYTLFCSPDLTAESWLAVDEPLIGNGTDMGHGITLTQPNDSQPDAMFWRVKVEDTNSDGDGLTDAEESVLGTNSALADSDGDGMSDAFKVANGLNPNDNGSIDLVNGPQGDKDGDGLANSVDASPGDGTIDWKRTANPNFAVIELTVFDPASLALDDLSENGTMLLSRISTAHDRIERVLVGRNLQPHSLPLEPQAAGQFGSYAPTLLGDQIIGFRWDQTEGWIECTWDPVTDSFTPIQISGYQDDICDVRGDFRVERTTSALVTTPQGILADSTRSDARIEQNGNIVSQNGYWRYDLATNTYGAKCNLTEATGARSATLTQKVPKPEGEGEIEKTWNLVAGVTGLHVSKDNSPFVRSQLAFGPSRHPLGVTSQGWVATATEIWSNGTWRPLLDLLSGTKPTSAILLGILDTGLGVAKIQYATGPPRIALIMPLNLDVNDDGDLSDPCDGLSNYLPGYELATAKLHSGDSFQNATYTGPQCMRILLEGLGTGLVDSATFKIVDTTRWPGYCGNGNDPQLIDDPEVNMSADFSFAPDFDDNEITGTVETDKVWAPIYCKDYGAYCKVEIVLKKSGVPITPQPIRLTIPRDDNGDKLADLWQDQQIDEWNHQFASRRPHTDVERDKMKPDETTQKYPDDELTDPDGSLNGDGGRNLAYMAAPGDGLTVLEEYRGFILDGGPKTNAGQHKRLSTARKELLVECSVERDLTTTVKNGEGTNQTALASFTVASVMADVSAFYSDSEKGTAIDLYWSQDELVQPGQVVSYAPSPIPNRNAWEWSGRVDYKGSLPDQQSDVVVPVTGAGVPLRDSVWRKLDPDGHDLFYGNTSTGNFFSVNRNPSLEAFVKLVMPTRLGHLRGGLDTNNGVDPSVSRYLGEAVGHSWGECDGGFAVQGARVCVSALADEGIGYWKHILNRHFTEVEFSRLIRRVIAHELGHLIVGKWHLKNVNEDTIMEDGPMVLGDGTVKGLSTCKWHGQETQRINLRNRYSVNPNRP